MLIHLKDLNRIFTVGDQKVHALDNVNLQVAAGEYISIMGPSGSGKSTLLNIIGLLDRATSGTFHLEGSDVTTLSDNQLAEVRSKTIGFVFQFFHLIPRLTARQNIELPLLLADVNPDERNQKSETIIHDFGLLDRINHRPDELSGGQRQRVAIARAVVNNPSVVLADEPTGNLDSTSGSEIIGLLEQLHEKGLTLIIVTHDPDIGNRAGRRLHVVDGRIASDENR